MRSCPAVGVVALLHFAVGCTNAWSQPAPRADAAVTDARAADPADVAGLSSHTVVPTAAQRARVPIGMALVAGATWRLGGRWVSVGTFAIDRTEVTVARWRACVAANRCPALTDPLAAMTRPTAPVVNVTHAQAAAYCTFAGGRLPTDAEWSLAARGIEGRRSPWGTLPPTCARAHTSGCGDTTRLAGTLPTGASPEGVLDLVGNVAEWVNDREGSLTAVTGIDRDPTGPTEGDARWTRGGSFRTAEADASGFAREAINALEARVDVGFRCVRGL